nr:hypothetical protein [Tanacetum cinerariifolium]
SRMGKTMNIVGALFIGGKEFLDIQYVGSNTRPSTLDRVNFESWQQRIRLDCMGKDNKENIIKSIDEGTKPQFKMAGLLFRMFIVDRKEFREIMQGEQLQLDNRVVLDEEQLFFIISEQANTFDEDVDEAPVEDLEVNEDNVFQVDQCDAFDSDIDEALTPHTIFMANLSSSDLIYDEDGPSYDSNILSEVQDHDNYLDNVGEYHEYVKENEEKVVQSNVSSIPNDALMIIINDMHKHATQCVSANEQSKVANASLTAELAR